ncbi:MAG: hypothetical protein ACKPEY_07375 [Planctomycetota bacterium]
MTAKQLTIALTFVLAGFLLHPSTAAAQGNFPRRYQSPSGPTITPYLDYFRQDNGVLNPYYNFIRPKAEMRNSAQQLTKELRATEANAKLLGREMKDLQTAPSRAAATGTAATFDSLGHYYSGGGGGGGRRRR